MRYRIGEFDRPGLHCMFAGSCGSRTVTVTLERPLGDRPLVNMSTGTKVGGPDGKTITIVQSPEPLLDDRFAVGSVGGRDAYASDIGRAIEFQIGSTETVRIMDPTVITRCSSRSRTAWPPADPTARATGCEPHRNRATSR